MKIENILKISALLSVIFTVYLLAFFFLESYLPAPFVVNKNDTFMDFYNVFHWSMREGAYTEWASVYPPVNFLIIGVFKYIFDVYDLNGGSILLRDKIGSQIIYLIII